MSKIQYVWSGRDVRVLKEGGGGGSKAKKGVGAGYLLVFCARFSRNKRKQSLSALGESSIDSLWMMGNMPRSFHANSSSNMASKLSHR